MAACHVSLVPLNARAARRRRGAEKNWMNGAIAPGDGVSRASLHQHTIRGSKPVPVAYPPVSIIDGTDCLSGVLKVPAAEAREAGSAPVSSCPRTSPADCAHTPRLFIGSSTRVERVSRSSWPPVPRIVPVRRYSINHGLRRSAGAGTRVATSTISVGGG